MEFIKIKHQRLCQCLHPNRNKQAWLWVFTASQGRVPMWTDHSAAQRKAPAYCSVHAIIRISLSRHKGGNDSRLIILLPFASWGIAQGRWVYQSKGVHMSECVFTCNLCVQPYLHACAWPCATCVETHSGPEPSSDSSRAAAR